MGRVEIYESGIAELAHDPTGEVAQDMERAAYLVENEAKLRILRPGSGFVYKPGHYLLIRGGKWYAWTRTLPAHQASSPGDSPSSDTGMLLSSISHMIEEDENGIYFDVGSPLEYSLYLELGTKLMWARPFLRPSLDVLTDAVIVPEAEDHIPEPPGHLIFTALDQTEPSQHLGRGK